MRIADESIHAVPTQCLLFPTDVAQEESSGVIVATTVDCIIEDDDVDDDGDDAATATVAMDEMKEEGDAKDIWVTTTTLLWLPEGDKIMDGSGSEAKAAMYSKRIKPVKTVGSAWWVSASWSFSFVRWRRQEGACSGVNELFSLMLRTMALVRSGTTTTSRQAARLSLFPPKKVHQKKKANKALNSNVIYGR